MITHGCETSKILRSGLVVSCQALENEPFYGVENMVLMAKAAMIGGAVGIRSNSPEVVRAICSVTTLPIIGIYKAQIPGYEVQITPTIQHIQEIANSGADVIAFDATNRSRPNNQNIKNLIEFIHGIGKEAFADVSIIEEALNAADLGADYVSSTLSGYTSYSPTLPGPDLCLLEKMVNHFKGKNSLIVGEGRFCSPQQVIKAFEIGVHAVVVGSAITRPQWITQQYTKAIKDYKSATNN